MASSGSGTRADLRVILLRMLSPHHIFRDGSHLVHVLIELMQIRLYDGIILRDGCQIIITYTLGEGSGIVATVA